MRHARFSTRGLIILAGGVVLALGASNTNLPGQNHFPGAAPAYQANIGTHESQTEIQTGPEFPEVSETTTQGEFEMPPPTRATFMARWDSVNGATGYLLDVSTSNSFISYVDGYHDLDVGSVIACAVTSLSRGTTYYYRVRPYDANGPGRYSDVMTVTTVPTTGPIIHPTFDSSITNHPNAAAIEAMINRAISIYESLFSDPITIQIRFRYSSTAPDGTPLPAGTVSRSDWVFYAVPWSNYINALRADATTGNDNLANASLPGAALSTYITPSSASGRAVTLNTPPAMFANGTVGNGGPYDGIVTLNSSKPFDFARPTSANYFDAQRSTEHEIDEVIGLGSHLNISGTYSGDYRPQDLFSWSSAGHRNISSSGTRYFSINGGATNVVSFSQNPSGDFGDWLSTACPQAHPYVQNAFGCTGQSSDVTATSPEGINLDVIGYDLANAPTPTPTPTPTPIARAAVADFNGDGHPDLVVQNAASHQTVIGYLNNNVVVGAAYGPTLPGGWKLKAAADFNRDSYPDYALFIPSTGQTIIGYLSGPTVIGAALGPALPGGWELVAAADFNGDGYPDYVLYVPSTHQTVIGYLNNNVVVGAALGPPLPAGWNLMGVADFNRDGNPDYALFNPTTGQTLIGYLSGRTVIGAAVGPTLSSGWQLVAVADFNGDGGPDYLLYKASTRQTAIWYLNNNIYAGGASGPTLPFGWSLVAP
jgi:FG-GAP-like repeat